MNINKHKLFFLIIGDIYDNMPLSWHQETNVKRDNFHRYLQIRALKFDFFKIDGIEVLVPNSFKFESATEKQFKANCKFAFRKFYDNDIVKHNAQGIMKIIIDEYKQFFQWLNNENEQTIETKN